jgi:hypothetical protein
MQASEYYAQLQQREQASTVATRLASPQDIRQATGSHVVDWHADRKTEQE